MNNVLEGVFNPPSVGAERAPAPIAGPGRIELTPQGLVVSGFKPKSSALRMLLFIVVFAVFIVVVGVGVVVFPQLDATLKMSLALAVIAPIAMAILQAGRGHDASAPLRVEIPWAKVESVKLLGANLLIGLRGFASATPLPVKIAGNAVVWFGPSSDITAADTALNAALYASRAAAPPAAR